MVDDSKTGNAAPCDAALLPRRDVVKGIGLALGAAALPAASLIPRRARAADRTEITFASAKFFGKQTIAEVVDAYYRTDLLQEIGAAAPQTWPELVDAAQKIQAAGKAKFGFLWQGKQAEVLVCDLVEFVASNGGGILGPDGKSVRIADPQAIEAVQ